MADKKTAGRHPDAMKRDSLTIVDRASRRRFVTRGSAWLITGASSLLASSHLAAADCDRNRNQVRRCSDADSGENSDPTGCGRCGRSDNVPAEWRQHQEPAESVTVKRIRYNSQDGDIET